MKIPCINTDPELSASVEQAVAAVNAELGPASGGGGTAYQAVHLRDAHEAVEYINYQTPALIMINFSDEGIGGFEIMQQIVADPWLNNGGIIAMYGHAETLEAINGLKGTNILISLGHEEVPTLLPKVLRVVRENQQFLFQRAFQTDFVADISGRFVLEADLLIIPCYTNLVATYLYNLGFVDDQAKGKVALSLSEMLINAIEHGNCGITNEEKTAYLEAHGAIHGLIEQKQCDPAVSARRAEFHYDISRSGSTFRISDEGAGFDWRAYADPERELDLLSIHGRGILMTLGSMDAVTYNDAGNEVTLTFTHRQHATNAVPLVFRDHEAVAVRPDDVVFRQGEESDFLYYIAEGVYRVEVDGRVIATISPEDILMGEMSFLLQEARSATVIANTPGRLIKISNVALINSIKNQPYYGLFLAKLLAQRLFRLGRSFVD